MTAAVGTACTNAPAETGVAANVEWEHYGGDAGGTKYSNLAQVNRVNVKRLKVAWLVRAADFSPSVFDPMGHRAGMRRENGARVSARAGASCGYCHSTTTRFEATPLMSNGVLYLSTPRNRVLALDAETGAIRWTFDPKISIDTRYAEDFTSRGVSIWIDDRMEGDRCARRIFLATVDARLYALDAATGLPCQNFGNRGFVRLDVGIGLNSRRVDPTQYTITSPPAVAGDVVIVGSAVAKNLGRDAPSGLVRAYDARTGALRWSFDPIPRTERHHARDFWTSDAARRTGGANVWSVISVDAERDLVFLPTGSAAPDSYGGERPGRNDFANSVVALRASTGDFKWSFQLVHHDLWDYDVAAQPVLITLRRGGHETPAVIAAAKTGMIFVLHRESGLPLLRVEERAVPVSDVTGEVAWPTQPFPVETPLLRGTRLTPDSAFGITDVDRTFCRELIRSLRNEGVFTPPSLKGTLVWPGYWGGINWDGIARDPERQLIVTTIKRLATVVQLHKRDDIQSRLPNSYLGGQYMPQLGTPYAMTRRPLVARSGVPCTPPPWGSIVAVDVARGAIRWQRELGNVPWLAQFAGSQAWGSVLFGGPLITAGGLVFVAGSQDDQFRAFDIETGALLWEHKLPAGGQASPMTYLHNGRQYVVIAAGGRSGIGSPGDWIMAFSLPH